MMQGPEYLALGNSIELINTRAKDIRKSIEEFLHKLDKDHSSITWPNVLDNFALLSGQISTFLNAVKSDKTPPLRNFAVVPHRLSPDPDQQLLWLTDGRLSLMSHAEVPDYLRTKPDPEVEQAERQLSVEVASHGEQAASSSQVALFNRHCNKALEKVKAHGNFQKDISRHIVNPSVNSRQTQELFATFYYGRGMKSLPLTTGGPGINIAPGSV